MKLWGFCISMCCNLRIFCVWSFDCSNAYLMQSISCLAVLQSRPTKGTEYESEEGLGNCIGTLVTTGRQSHSNSMLVIKAMAKHHFLRKVSKKYWTFYKSYNLFSFFCNARSYKICYINIKIKVHNFIKTKIHYPVKQKCNERFIQNEMKKILEEICSQKPLSFHQIAINISFILLWKRQNFLTLADLLFTVYCDTVIKSNIPVRANNQGFLYPIYIAIFLCLDYKIIVEVAFDKTANCLKLPRGDYKALDDKSTCSILF